MRRTIDVDVRGLPEVERVVTELCAERDALAEAVVLLYERFMSLARERTRLGADGVAKVTAAYEIAQARTTPRDAATS